MKGQKQNQGQKNKQTDGYMNKSNHKLRQMKSGK